MAIRSAAKAVILKDGKVLLNHCHSRSLGEHYALPGGGQVQHESLREAVLRECVEETGCLVVIDRFLALCEEIYTNEAVRERHPDYSHRVYHIFLCHLKDETTTPPTEMDANQLGSVWIPIEEVAKLNLYPRPLAASLARMIVQGDSAWFETDYVDT